jgi:group I intron endonuclease
VIIYKITNKINGKVYIGRTSRSVEERWKQHCYDAKVKRLCFKFQEAIKEYGAENFTVEQIDCAATKEEANAKEAYWIKFYDSVATGYNVSLGGNASANRKKVMAVESGLVFDSMNEAAKHFGLSHSMIPAVVNKPHLKAAGQHWITIKK